MDKQMNIGEVERFEVYIKCVEDTQPTQWCKACVFRGSDLCADAPECRESARKDGKSVHFEIAEDE